MRWEPNIWEGQNGVFTDKLLVFQHLLNDQGKCDALCVAKKRILSLYARPKHSKPSAKAAAPAVNLFIFAFPIFCVYRGDSWVTKRSQQFTTDHGLEETAARLGKAC